MPYSVYAVIVVAVEEVFPPEVLELLFVFVEVVVGLVLGLKEAPEEALTKAVEPAAKYYQIGCLQQEQPVAQARVATLQ